MSSGSMSVTKSTTVSFAPQEDWGPIRLLCYRILNATFPDGDTNIFDTGMGVVIALNAITLALEADQIVACASDGGDDCVHGWIGVVNVALLVIYFIELVMRLVEQRLRFFRNGWNLLDFLIVIFGALGLLWPTDRKHVATLFNVFRLCRLIRVVRIAKVLNRFQTLKSMVNGFAGAMKSMTCGIVLILLLLFMWSILAVEIISPINSRIEHHDKYCEQAFTSVIRTTLYFFQTLVAGDEWSRCAMPIIKEEPWTYVFFAICLVSVQLGFMNLVLAVIVDKAAEAREGDKEEQAKQRKQAEAESIGIWRETMKELDADGSGTITELELLEGYKHSKVRHAMASMNIFENDLKGLFKLMDFSNSGQLGYDEFVENFSKAQTQDPRIALMTLRLTVEQLVFKVTELLSSKQEASDGAKLGGEAGGAGAGAGSQFAFTELDYILREFRSQESIDSRDSDVMQPQESGIHRLGWHSEQHGEREFQTEACFRAAPPSQEVASTLGQHSAWAQHQACAAAGDPLHPQAEVAAASARDPELASRLRSLQENLEARLDGIVAEARAAAACLARQGTLLALGQCCPPPRPPPAHAAAPAVGSGEEKVICGRGVLGTAAIGLPDGGQAICRGGALCLGAARRDTPDHAEIELDFDLDGHGELELDIASL